MHEQLLRYWLRRWDEARWVGIKRRVVNSWTDVVRYLEEEPKYVDKYASIFSFYQIENKLFDVIFLDVDVRNGEGRDIYRGTVRQLLEYGIEPDVYSSGRGYHIYIRFPEMQFGDYRYVARKFVGDFLGLDRYMTRAGVKDGIDRTVVGDVKRIARLPGTVNSKSGSVVDLLVRGRVSSEVGRILKELDSEREYVVYTDDVEEEYLLVDDVKFPPCIESSIKRLMETGELDHEERLNMSSFLIHVKGYEYVYSLFRKYARDFRPSVTSYQLRWIMRNRYKPYSCKRLKAFGLCPRTCEFYPWMWITFGRVVRNGNKDM